jgi:hypothetical protein
MSEATCGVARCPGCRCAHPGYEPAFWRRISAMRKLPVVLFCRRHSACAVGQISCLNSPVPRPIKRGASRSSRVLVRDAMAVRRAKTKRGSRTAKSCGPDLPTLGSSSRVDPRMTVARKPGHRGRARISRKTIARGMPVVRLPCGCLRAQSAPFFCTQGSRVRPASGIPCALRFFEGHDDASTRTRFVPRE